MRRAGRIQSWAREQPNHLQLSLCHPPSWAGPVGMAPSQPAFCEVSFNEVLLSEELARGLTIPLLREEGTSGGLHVLSAL